MAIDYDFFVSYARVDNQHGYIKAFVDGIVAEHQRFTGGRTLNYFFDTSDIPNFASWELEIFQKHLVKARLFLAFLSPAYFASDICRREWRAWIDREIAIHVLGDGAAPIYFIEVPGMYSKPMLSEHEVARRVAELCQREQKDRFLKETGQVVSEVRRRQLVARFVDNIVQPFQEAGRTALQAADLQDTLSRLAKDLDRRSQEVLNASASDCEVRAYNRRFTGRHQELLDLRKRLTDNGTGVVAGIHGLGGIGKTELAITYAHAFGSVYPGGRYYIPCEYKTSLQDAMLHLGEYTAFHRYIKDEERKNSTDYFAAIRRTLKIRLTSLGRVLLILDNVTQPDLVSHEQTDCLTSLGGELHLLATTRLAPSPGSSWIILGELNPEDALALLERYRRFENDSEQVAAQTIVKKLGGFTLAIELVAANLAAHPSATYSSMAESIGLDDLDLLAEDQNLKLREHNHERRLNAILGPTLASLSAEQRRTMEYAAFLPPDMTPLPWLKELVTSDFPELRQHDRLKGDPWENICDWLVRLGLFTRLEEADTNRRIVRVHRLVQAVLYRELPQDEFDARDRRIRSLIEAREAALSEAANLVELRWEVDPLDAMASSWDETDDPWAAWLLNSVGELWHQLAAWSRAEPRFRRALVLAQQSDGSTTSVHDVARLLRRAKRRGTESLFTELAFAGVSSRVPPKPQSVAKCMNNLALVLLEQGHYQQAEPLFCSALTRDEQTLGPDHPHVATRLVSLASLLKDTNRIEEAEQHLRRALSIYERHFGKDHPHVATALNNLSDLLLHENRLQEAEPLIRRNLAILETHYGPDHHKLAASLSNLAAFLLRSNRLDEAETVMRRVLSLDEQFHGADHPNVAGSLNNLAHLLVRNHRYKEAEPLRRRALAIDEQAYGPKHPDVARDLNNLGELLLLTQRHEEAEPLLRRAAQIIEAALGTDDPHLSIILNNLTSLLQATNREVEAESLLRQILKSHEQHLRPDHPEIVKALTSLARLLETTSRPQDAELLLRRAIALAESSNAVAESELTAVRSCLASVLVTLNRAEEALPIAKQVLASDLATFDEHDTFIAGNLMALGLAFQALHRRDDAEQLMRRSLAIHERCYGETNRAVARDRNNLALLLMEKNRLDEAEALLRSALTIMENVYSKGDPQIALALNSLAILLRRKNDLTGSEALLRRALTIVEQSLGPDDPEVARELCFLAQVLCARGSQAEAVPLFRRAWAIYEKENSPLDSNLNELLTNFAQLLLRTKQLSEAETLLRRHLQLCERSPGQHDRMMVQLLNRLAELLIATHRQDEIEPLLRRIVDILERTPGTSESDLAAAFTNLGHMVYSTGRHEEAEPLLRRAMSCLCRASRASGRAHPQINQVFQIYWSLLAQLQIPEMQRVATLTKLGFDPNWLQD